MAEESKVGGQKSYTYAPTLMFWGSPGTQKTRLASMFPGAHFLDINKGLSSISERIENGSCTYQDINEWNDLTPAINYIRGHKELRTIITDDVTTMSLLFALEHARARGKATGKDQPISLQDYGQSSGNLRVACYNIWALKDRIRIFIATQELEAEKVQFGIARAGERGKDPVYTGEYGRVPAIPGKFGEELAALCNEVWFFDVRSGAKESVWKIRTKPDGGLIKLCKSRAGTLPEVIDNTDVSKSYEVISKALNL